MTKIENWLTSTKGNKEWKRFTNNVRCICWPNAALITENDFSRYRLPCFEIRALFSLVSAVSKLRNIWLVESSVLEKTLFITFLPRLCFTWHFILQKKSRLLDRFGTWTRMYLRLKSQHSVRNCNAHLWTLQLRKDGVVVARHMKRAIFITCRVFLSLLRPVP